MENQKESRPHFSRKLIVILTVAIVVIAGGVCWHASMSNNDPFPKAIRAEATFPLYYPSPLPPSWTVVSSSFYISEGIVGYRIASSSGSINITIQPVPKNFDFTNFYSKKLTNSSLISTPLGEGAIGKADNSFLVGSLAIGNTWLIATPSTSSVTEPDIQFVLNHLEKS